MELNDSNLYAYSAYYDDRKRLTSAKEGDDPIVRINVLAPKEFKYKNKNTLCLVKLTNGRIFMVNVHVVQILEHFGMKWTSYFVNCKLTQIITRKLHRPNSAGSPEHSPNKIDKQLIHTVVLVNNDEDLSNYKNTSDSELKVHMPKSYTPNITNTTSILPKQSNKLAICIKPIHLNWNRAIWLVEFIEMYRLLGKLWNKYHKKSIKKLSHLTFCG